MCKLDIYLFEVIKKVDSAMTRFKSTLSYQATCCCALANICNQNALSASFCSENHATKDRCILAVGGFRKFIETAVATIKYCGQYLYSLLFSIYLANNLTFSELDFYLCEFALKLSCFHMLLLEGFVKSCGFSSGGKLPRNIN